MSIARVQKVIWIFLYLWWLRLFPKTIESLWGSFFMKSSTLDTYLSVKQIILTFRMFLLLILGECIISLKLKGFILLFPAFSISSLLDNLSKIISFEILLRFSSENYLSCPWHDSNCYIKLLSDYGNVSIQEFSLISVLL